MTMKSTKIQPRFVAYRIGGDGELIRACVRRHFRNGRKLVEPFFAMTEDGADVPVFQGGFTLTLAPHQIVAHMLG